MNTYVFFNEVIIGFIESILIFLLFLYFVDKTKFIQHNKIRLTLFVIFYTCVSYWTTKFFPVPFNTIVISVFLTITLSYFTTTNIYATLISLAVVFIIMIGVEVITWIGFIAVYKKPLAVLFENSMTKLQFSVIVKIIEGLVAFLLYRIKLKFFKFSIMEKNNALLSFSIFQATMMIMLLFSINFFMQNQHDYMLYSFLICVICIFVVFIGILDLKEREKMLIVQNKYEAQEEQVKNMDAMMNIIRKEKHDFRNHLNTIYAVSVLDKPNTAQKIKEYTEQLIRDTHTDALNSQFDTGNVCVDGLLAVKSHFASKLHIDFDVNIEAPLQLIEINDNHLTNVLGNIIDNAFEALVKHRGDNEKWVSLYSFIDRDHYCIAISDNACEIPKEVIAKIFESGYSTKGENRKDHGFGLFITKEIVEKNNGTINVKSNAHETEFLIKFKIREGSYGEDGSIIDKCNSIA